MKIQLKSIQLKILFWGGLCLLLMATILIAYSAITLRSTVLTASENNVQTTAESIGGQLKSDVSVALDASRTIAQMLKAIRTQQTDLSRDQASDMIRQVLEDNPSFLGTYTLWEPNAFDGKDFQFANEKGHDSTGRMVPYWSRDENNNLSVTPLVDYETEGAGDWYLIPKKTKTESVIGPLLYPVGNKTVLMISLIAPIVVNDQFYGIAGIDLQSDFLQKMVDDVDLYNKSGEAILVNYDGVIGGVTGKPDFAGKELKEYLSATWEEDLGYVQQDQVVPVTRNGVLSVIVPVKLGYTTKNWAVIINVPLNAITAEANQKMWEMILIGVIMALSGLVMLWFVGRQIAKPIQKITNAAKIIASGDLSQEVEIHQADEIGQLADAFREMTDSLKTKAGVMETIAKGDLTVQVVSASEKDVLAHALTTMVNHLRHLVGQVAESALNLGNASGQLANASNEAGQATTQIATTIQQVAKGITQQSESISKTVDSVEQVGKAIEGVTKGAQDQSVAVANASGITSELSVIIQNVASQAGQQAQNADETVSASNESAQIVTDTVKGMEAIKSKVNLSSEKVKEMGKRSEEIEAIIETIEDIASQTNLLALNAAIEAARAGEHGKGFAVVADEVRKLAEKSAFATKEIAGLIRGIQKTVTEAIQAMEESSTEVEKGVGLAGKSRQSLDSILQAAVGSKKISQNIATAATNMNALANSLTDAMDSVSAVVEENTAATEEMSANSNEMTMAVETIASVSEENSAAVEEVSASTEEMTAQVEEVNASAQTLAEMAENLSRVIAQFRLE